MSQFSPSGINPHRATSSRPATWALLVFPALGCMVAAASAFAAFIFASLAGTLALGDSAGPGQPAYDYVNAHFPNSAFGFLTGSPLVLGACCALALGATGLAAFRRWALTGLLLFAVAAMPWVPAVGFVYHLSQLPLH